MLDLLIGFILECTLDKIVVIILASCFHVLYVATGVNGDILIK